jgi:hypothetical protein
MQEITYDNRKAYLLTSDDIFLFDKPLQSQAAADIIHKLENARKDGFVFIFIMTSLKKQSIPLGIRRFLEAGKKNCYFGTFTSCSEKGESK